MEGLDVSKKRQKTHHKPKIKIRGYPSMNNKPVKYVYICSECDTAFPTTEKIMGHINQHCYDDTYVSSGTADNNVSGDSASQDQISEWHEPLKSNILSENGQQGNIVSSTFPSGSSCTADNIDPPGKLNRNRHGCDLEKAVVKTDEESDSTYSHGQENDTPGDRELDMLEKAMDTDNEETSDAENNKSDLDESSKMLTDAVKEAGSVVYDAMKDTSTGGNEEDNDHEETSDDSNEDTTENNEPNLVDSSETSTKAVKEVDPVVADASKSKITCVIPRLLQPVVLLRRLEDIRAYEKSPTDLDSCQTQMTITDKRTESLVCKRCQVTFRSKACYANHLIIHHFPMYTRKAAFSCQLCKNNPNTYDSYYGNCLLKFHLMNGHDADDLKCMQCNSEFESYLDFHEHVHVCSGQLGKFNCKQCKTFHLTDEFKLCECLEDVKKNMPNDACTVELKKQLSIIMANALCKNSAPRYCCKECNTYFKAVSCCVNHIVKDHCTDFAKNKHVVGSFICQNEKRKTCGKKHVLTITSTKYLTRFFFKRRGYFIHPKNEINNTSAEESKVKSLKDLDESDMEKSKEEDDLSTTHPGKKLNNSPKRDSNTQSVKEMNDSDIDRSDEEGGEKCQTTESVTDRIIKADTKCKGKPDSDHQKLIDVIRKNIDVDLGYALRINSLNPMFAKTKGDVANAMVERINIGIDGYECAICLEQFSKYACCKSHVLTYHFRLYIYHKGSETYTCPACLVSYHSLKKLNLHLHFHKIFRFKCSECKEMFSTSEDYDKHSKHGTGKPQIVIDQKYSCSNCGLIHNCTVIPNEEEKLKHITPVGKFEQSNPQYTDFVYSKIAFDGVKFSCAICRDDFETLACCTTHILLEHETEERAVCSVCRLGFRAREDLIKHWKYMHGLESIYCKICCKGFESSAEKKSHLKRCHHSENKKIKQKLNELVCKQCLRSHLAYGSKQNEIETCKECCTGFQSISCHRNHQFVEHTPGDMMLVSKYNSYQCPCGQDFIQRNELYNHLREAHASIKSVEDIKKEVTDTAESSTENVDGSTKSGEEITKEMADTAESSTKSVDESVKSVEEITKEVAGTSASSIKSVDESVKSVEEITKEMADTAESSTKSVDESAKSVEEITKEMAGTSESSTKSVDESVKSDEEIKEVSGTSVSSTKNVDESTKSVQDITKEVAGTFGSSTKSVDESAKGVEEITEAVEDTVKSLVTITETDKSSVIENENEKYDKFVELNKEWVKCGKCSHLHIVSSKTSEIVKHSSKVKCNTCKNRFRNTKCLLHHELVDHPNNLHIYQCVGCNLYFHSSSILNSHQGKDGENKEIMKKTSKAVPQPPISNDCGRPVEMLTTSNDTTPDISYTEDNMVELVERDTEEITCKSKCKLVTCKKCSDIHQSNFDTREDKTHTKRDLNDMLKINFKRHVCRINKACKFACSSIDDLRKHKEKFHSKDSFVMPNNECTICNKRFSSTSELCDHVVQDHGTITFIQGEILEDDTKSFECRYCPNHYQFPMDAQLHLRRTHFEKPLVIVYHQKDALNPQYKTALVTFCPLCFRVAQSFHSLKDNNIGNTAFHIKRHFPSLDVCAKCGKQNVGPGCCKTAQFTVCDVCGKTVSAESYRLKQHIQGHTGKRLFKCDVCGKDFKFKPNLVAHKLTHGEKSETCPICGMKFTLPHHVRAHTKRVHSVMNA